MDDDSDLAPAVADERLPQGLPTFYTADPAAGLDYLRRAYGGVREWYSVSETKAQLILAANGAFISVTLGVMLGTAGDLASVSDVHLGPETWALHSAAFVAIAAGVSCAASAMWSLHGAVQAEWRLIHTWECLEAHVRGEREFRGKESAFLNSYERFVARIKNADLDAATERLYGKGLASKLGR